MALGHGSVAFARDPRRYLRARPGWRQRRPGRTTWTSPSSSRQAAPIDLTGYWVSLVTEDWLYRMVTPAKGDYASVPVNAAGRAAADAWDPAKDEAAGEQCKSYGARGDRACAWTHAHRMAGRQHA